MKSSAMGFIFIGMAVVGALLTSGTGFFVVAIGNAVGSVWSNGVLANFQSDPQNAPNVASLISLGTTLAALALIVVGLVLR